VSDERLPDKIKTRIQDGSEKARLSAVRGKISIIRKTSKEYGKNMWLKVRKQEIAGNR
jgi:hypothetical protein